MDVADLAHLVNSTGMSYGEMSVSFFISLAVFAAAILLRRKGEIPSTFEQWVSAIRWDDSPVTLCHFGAGFLVLLTKPIWATRISRHLFSTASRGEIVSAVLHPTKWRTLLVTMFRVFSSSLGHSSWRHFQGNMSLLLLMGPGIEHRFGSVDTTVMVLVANAADQLYNFVFSPNVIGTGASGVVFMFMVMSALIAADDHERRVPIVFFLVVATRIPAEVTGLLDRKTNTSHTGAYSNRSNGIYP